MSPPRRRYARDDDDEPASACAQLPSLRTSCFIGFLAFGAAMAIMGVVNKGPCASDWNLGTCVGVWCGLSIPCVILLGSGIALCRAAGAGDYASAREDNEEEGDDEAPPPRRTEEPPPAAPAAPAAPPSQTSKQR